MRKDRVCSLVGRTAPLVAVALLAAGCGSNKSRSAAASATGTSMSSNHSMPGGANGSMAAMPGMGGSGAGGTGTVTSVNGIRPVATQTLASTSWQGMRITARAMTAVPFVIYNGTGMQMVKPTRKDSFHLMVMLSDAQTGMPIPYATVWATIRQHGKVIYDERQWPMISRYMGPHYGNDVPLPGAGTYQLSLLVSPPVSARHVEYENVWLKAHRATVSFHWNGA